MIDRAIEKLSRGVHSKVTSMDREAIEHIETSLMDQEVVEKLLRGVHSKVTLMDRKAIENLSSIQKLL